MRDKLARRLESAGMDARLEPADPKSLEADGIDGLCEHVFGKLYADVR